MKQKIPYAQTTLGNQQFISADKTMNVKIPRSLYRKFKDKYAARGWSQTKAVRELIEKWVEGKQ